MGRFFPLFRKVCDHPYLLLDVKPTAGESEEQALEKMIAASGKLTLLDKMLPRLQVCRCCFSAKIFHYSRFSMAAEHFTFYSFLYK